jgi:hypothetical protein
MDKIGGAISKRLDAFMEDHMVIEDVGDSENGPELSMSYNGPEWAERLDAIAEGFYPHFKLCQNIFGCFPNLEN